MNDWNNNKLNNLLIQQLGWYWQPAQIIKLMKTCSISIHVLCWGEPNHFQVVHHFFELNYGFRVKIRGEHHDVRDFYGAFCDNHNFLSCLWPWLCRWLPMVMMWMSTISIVYIIICMCTIGVVSVIMWTSSIGIISVVMRISVICMVSMGVDCVIPMMVIYSDTTEVYLWSWTH